MQYSTRDLARLTGYSRASITNQARTLRINQEREEKVYFFNEEQRVLILRGLRISPEIISAKETAPRHYLITRRNNNGSVSEEEYVTLKEAIEITGEPYGTWWARVSRNRTDKKTGENLGPLCRGLVIGNKQLVALSEVMRMAQSLGGYTIADAGRMLDLSKRTLYNYVNEGVFHPRKRANQRTLVDDADLEKIRARFERSRKRHSPKQPPEKRAELQQIKQDIFQGKFSEELRGFCRGIETAIEMRPQNPPKYQPYYHTSSLSGVRLEYFLWFCKNMESFGKEPRRKLIRFISQLERALTPQLPKDY